MYTGAVLNAVKDCIVNSAVSSIVKPNEISLSYDGTSVHPAIGQRFILVHPIDRANPSGLDNLIYEDVLTFGVTVGIQSREIPKDRIQEYLYNNTINNNVGLDLLRDIIIILINNSSNTIYSNIVSSINSTIDTLPTQVRLLINNNIINIVNRIKYLSTDANPVLRYPDYFGSTQSVESEPRPAGMTFTTVFQAPQIMAKTGC